MLSRTADNLYWLARYMERADFLSRAIEASRRLASLPKTYGGQRANGIVYYYPQDPLSLSQPREDH